MSFVNLAERRYSVRAYKDKPVEEEKLKKILEAGRLAPSAKNFQPLYFIVFNDKEMLKKVSSTYGREWILQSPVIIVICGDHQKSWRRPDGKDHCDIDAAIAIDHMTLAAADLGLGACWVCMFDSMQCHNILKLPPHLETIALLPLGYPADEEKKPEKKRKQLEEMVRWGGFYE